MREPEEIPEEEHEQVVAGVAAVDVAKASGMVSLGCRTPASPRPRRAVPSPPNGWLVAFAESRQGPPGTPTTLWWAAA